MPLILGTNSIKDTGFNVANSLRFNDGSSDYLTRAQSNGNQDKWTWSVWLKRSTLGSAQCFFASTNGSTTSFDAKFDSSNRIRVYNYFGGGFDADLVTTRVFRDVSAWYHIVVVYDSGNSTEALRFRIYVNGTEESVFSTTDYPGLNADSDLNVSGSNIEIGRQANGSQFFDGYMAEVVLIDGQALSPTSFGEFDSDTPNVWKPIDVSGLTFGTNGFYLDFENASSLGADVSGNSNNFTVNNLTSVDQSASTCTNNEATLNSLYKQASSYTIADGNLTANNSSNTWRGLAGTIGVSSGKWYWEAKAISGVGSSYLSFGIGDAEQIPNGDAEPTASSRIYSYKHNGDKANNNTQTSYGATWTNGDIISILYDADNGSLTFYKNGVSQGVAFSGLDTSKTWLPITENYGTAVMSMNFGSPPYSISSGNTDGNGYGNFEYAVPSGYYSLNTKNLAEYG